jgi:hypothetical protein
MCQIKLEHHFAFGLYVYLEQAELSTDRVLGHPWQMLCQFYKSDERIMPHIVIAAIKHILSNSSLDFNLLHRTINENMIFNKPSTKALIVFYRILRNAWRLFKDSWNCYLMKIVSLNEDQILFILQTLMKLDQFLNTEQSPNHWEIDSLRQDLYLSGIILRRRMPFCSECKKARKIEHLNQNEILTTLSFSEIVGRSQKEWIEASKLHQG